MKLLRLVSLSLFLSIHAGLAGAAEASEQAVKDLIEQYYALEQAENYGGMVHLFNQGAQVKYRYDFGWFFPDQVVKFKVENAESFKVLEDDSGEDYGISDYVRTIDKIELEDNKATVKVKVSFNYTYSGSKGDMKGTDTFQIDLSGPEARVASLSSSQKY